MFRKGLDRNEIILTRLPLHRLVGRAMAMNYAGMLAGCAAWVTYVWIRDRNKPKSIESE